MMDDYISRAAAIDEVDSETVSTNPEHFKSSEKFIKFMNDADIASFGKWQWAHGFNTALLATMIQLKKLPSVDVQPDWYDDSYTGAYVKEEDVLKFYYVESLNDYWIGRRLDNFYYATWDRNLRNFVWSKSRYLPWGEHVVAPDTLWKEHTYPSEPKEIPFADWLKGFYAKYFNTDVQPVVHGEWIDTGSGQECSVCGEIQYGYDSGRYYCANCGVKMKEKNDVGKSD